MKEDSITSFKKQLVKAGISSKSETDGLETQTKEKMAAVLKLAIDNDISPRIAYESIRIRTFIIKCNGYDDYTSVYIRRDHSQCHQPKPTITKNQILFGCIMTASTAFVAQMTLVRENSLSTLYNIISLILRFSKCPYSSNFYKTSSI